MKYFLTTSEQYTETGGYDDVPRQYEVTADAALHITAAGIAGAKDWREACARATDVLLFSQKKAKKEQNGRQTVGVLYVGVSRVVLVVSLEEEGIL